MTNSVLDPLVGRVRDAIRDADLPRTVGMPDFDELTRDLRRIDTPAAVEQLSKAIERIDIPKAIQKDLPKALNKIELPSAIEERLPGRKRRRFPMGLFGLLGGAALVAATVALVPPLRRRLRVAVDAAATQLNGMRGERHWSKGAGFAVAFPETPTAPQHDDPAQPGQPAPYPDGLGDQDASTEALLDRDYTEVTR